MAVLMFIPDFSSGILPGIPHQNGHKFNLKYHDAEKMEEKREIIWLSHENNYFCSPKFGLFRPGKVKHARCFRLTGITFKKVLCTL